MRLNHLIFSVCVVAVIAIFMSGQAFAGGGMSPPPETGGSVQGPEVWATVVLTCNAGEVSAVSLRAKQIEDCNVETQALMDSTSGLGWDCPQSGNDIVNSYLPALTLFGRTLPVITKVKNFSDDLGTISFDAQIKFWVPDATSSN